MSRGVISKATSVALDEAATQHEILARVTRLLPVRTYLEVGVRDGCTLWVVVEAGMGSLETVILADDWGRRHGGTNRGSHAHVAALLRTIGFGGSTVWLDGPSQETLPAFTPGSEEGVDLVHLDGDHDEEPAYQDVTNGWRLVRPGGALVVHDTRLAGVARAMHRFVDDVGDAVDYHTGGKGTAVAWKEGLA